MLTEITQTTDLTASALSLFESEMLRGVRARGRFAVALSGGSTPLGLYRALAGRTDLPWEQVLVFWGDERFVPHDHADSNYRAAREAFLDALPIPTGNIYPWPEPPAGEEARGEALERAAAAYAATLRSALGEEPVFDLQLLGLGDDAHTASLYPGDPAVRATGLTVAARPEAAPQARLSLTAPALSASRAVAFLVSGEGKRAAFEGTLSGAGEDELYPARAVTALERVVWLTDLAAPRAS